MSNIPLLNQLRTDSKDSKDPKMKKLNHILNNEDDGRRQYDAFVLGASSMLWGKKLPNDKRFDASSSLALYELSLSIDQRIIQQSVESSYLRDGFKNYPGEKIFYEYTGIEPTSTVYIPLQLEETGYDRTVTNKSSKIKTYVDPSEIKFIQAAVSPIRRDVKMYKEGFRLTLEQIELAAAMRLNLQDALTKRVARDLLMAEQDYAFNYQQAQTYPAPEGQGLFYNTSISTSISWTAGALLSSSTTGRAMVAEFVRIHGAILSATQNVFEQEKLPLACITSVANVNALTTPYSDLDGRSPMQYLTERGFRIAGMPIMGNNQSFFYYADSSVVELSTSRLVEAQPQSYDANKTAWSFPYRNITAGVTVKKPAGIYSVAGMNP